MTTHARSISFIAICACAGIATMSVAQPPPDPPPVFEHFGDAEDSMLGNSVARIGDINGDGRTDYAVGAPGTDDNQGAAYVYSGYDGSLLRTVTSASGGGLGLAVAGLGDANGDGVDDFAVSNPGWSQGGIEFGEVIVCSGAGGVIRTITSASETNLFGLGVAGAGDVNGDGLGDIIVGAPAVDANGDGCGQVFVYSAASGALLYSRIGEHAEDFLGLWSAGLGDVNDDGYADIALGAYAAGEVLIVDAHNQTVLRTLQVGQGDDPLVLASAGDLNLDGASELIVGLSTAAAGAGQVIVYDCVTGSPVLSFTGSADEQLGNNVGGGLDINGDENPDLLMTTRDFDYPSSDRWRVQIRSGHNGSFLRSFPASAYEAAISTAFLESVGPDAEFGVLTSNLWHNGNTGVARVFVIEPNEFGLDAAQTWANAGPAPGFIAAADLNKDGRTDLVTVSTPSDKFSLLFRTAAGTYSAAGTYAAGDGPMAVAAADFDRDGDNDLAVAAMNENRVILFRNSGTGFMLRVGDIKVGKRPSFVIAADLNNDGYIDLATTDKFDDTVTVLLHNKQTSQLLHQQFQPKKTYPVGDAPVHLAAGFMNADARIDLVIANDAGNSLTVLNSTAPGVFNNRKDTPTDARPACLALSDIDGDGYTDVAYVCRSVDMAQVRIGKNNGTFKPVHRFAVGAAPRAIATLDLDLDGFVDLATSNSADNTVTVLLNDMTGLFGAPLVHAVGLGPLWITSADLDNDDDDDVVSVGKTVPVASVLLNNWF